MGDVTFNIKEDLGLLLLVNPEDGTLQNPEDVTPEQTQDLQTALQEINNTQDFSKILDTKFTSTESFFAECTSSNITPQSSATLEKYLNIFFNNVSGSEEWDSDERYFIKADSFGFEESTALYLDILSPEKNLFTDFLTNPEFTVSQYLSLDWDDDPALDKIALAESHEDRERIQTLQNAMGISTIEMVDWIERLAEIDSTLSLNEILRLLDSQRKDLRPIASFLEEAQAPDLSTLHNNYFHIREQRESILEKALSQTGTPYKSKNHPKNFDCSHFVQFVYSTNENENFHARKPYDESKQKHDLSYPYQPTSALWNKSNRESLGLQKIKWENAQPGDLILWNGHVGIVTEAGKKFIGAQNDGVGITNYDSGYWSYPNGQRSYYLILRPEKLDLKVGNFSFPATSYDLVLDYPDL